MVRLVMGSSRGTAGLHREGQSLESAFHETKIVAASVAAAIVPTGRPLLGSAEVHVPCSPFVGSEDLGIAGLTLRTAAPAARAWVYSPSVYSRPASWE